MLRKIFWLTAQLEPYRIHIRLQVRVACLGGFLDLCQSVKNKLFDRLNTAIGDNLANCGVLLLGSPVLSAKFCGHTLR